MHNFHLSNEITAKNPPAPFPASTTIWNPSKGFSGNNIKPVKRICQTSKKWVLICLKTYNASFFKLRLCLVKKDGKGFSLEKLFQENCYISFFVGGRRENPFLFQYREKIKT